ncbi:conserved phage C-terminal domain-containing protein [Weeksella virosa]|uniref:conserved phage C-terminal domain-containing protein n=1 Tax=Weeksella virosa TaxID=1014 RepID=UPI002552909A|nr:conserved phage C-terminal domain-containing protein [Weeksella virosa]MDK7674367.1 conserved phage C-terminal domain-containing protein [Weeksella virosa]
MTREKKFIQKIANLEVGVLPSLGEMEKLILEARKFQSRSNVHPDAEEVLQFLNLKAKRRFSPRKSNLMHINARLQEGISAERLKQIIELKVYQWEKDYTMKAHLNPETLFRPSKIEKYLQEVEDILANPEKFKKHVERNHQEEERKSTMSGSKSDWFI